MTPDPLTSSPLRFTKMHGCGNDFVVIDCRSRPFALDRVQICHLGDRHLGIGFDQLLSIELANDSKCAFAYRIWNNDGSSARQCGNGVRCIAAWLLRAGAIREHVVRLEGPAGPVAVEWIDDSRIRVAMGIPEFAPEAIPLAVAERRDPYLLDIAGREVEMGAVSIGNPHALIEVDAVAHAPVAVLGPQIEHASVFARGCNVGFAEVVSRAAIRLRVWERGVGETLACGSGACAAVAILRGRNRVDPEVRVDLPGGTLEVQWSGEHKPIWLAGPAAFVFEGEWTDS
ncbi:MAG: diaminopimelate epimerase [Rhodanobacteraceae bacterium]